MIIFKRSIIWLQVLHFWQLIVHHMLPVISCYPAQMSTFNTSALPSGLCWASKGLMNWEIKSLLTFWHLTGDCAVTTHCTVQNSELPCSSKYVFHWNQAGRRTGFLLCNEDEYIKNKTVCTTQTNSYFIKASLTHHCCMLGPVPNGTLTCTFGLADLRWPPCASVR